MYVLFSNVYEKTHYMVLTINTLFTRYSNDFVHFTKIPKILKSH